MLSTTLLNKTTSGIGKRSGKLVAGPNYATRRIKWQIGGTPRLLYHSGLDEVIKYPQVPTKTEGFHYDILPRRDWTQAKTLTSNITQQWAHVVEDVVIKEFYEGSITQQESFFMALYRFWTTVLNIDEYIIWRPLDETDKLYRVRIVDVRVAGETMNPNYTSILLPDKWLKSPIEVHMKLDAAFPPSAVIYASGNLSEGSP